MTRLKLALTLCGALLELKSTAERQFTSACAEHCANEAIKTSDERWLVKRTCRAYLYLSTLSSVDLSLLSTVDDNH